MLNTLLVMAGGAIGAAMRYQLSRLVQPLVLTSPNGIFANTAFPWATLAANLIGGLAMGLLAGLLLRIGSAEQWRLFLGVGVLGGFTTFSAFSLEIFDMLHGGRWLVALGYVLFSVAGSVIALATGIALTRAL